jgi:hypothetical protein
MKSIAEVVAEVLRRLRKLVEKLNEINAEVCGGLSRSNVVRSELRRSPLRARPRFKKKAAKAGSDDGELADGYRLVGKRKLVRRDCEVEIAKDGRWLLVEIADWSKNGWLSCQLYLMKRAKKNMWQIGVKDGRAANNRSVAMLEERHPGRLQWVIDSVTRYQMRVR